MATITKYQESYPLSSAALAQNVLVILHNHDKLVKFQPYVEKTEPLSEPPACAKDDEQSPDHHWYRRTEAVPFLPGGLWKQKVVFENYFRDLPDTPVNPNTPTAATDNLHPLVEGGVESRTYAAMLQVKATFKVVKRQMGYKKDTILYRDKYIADDVGLDDGWKLVEDTEVTCDNHLIKWASVSLHRDAQKQMVAAVLHEANKKIYTADRS